jgi:radical SAM protein with 4Fe4S-binding SPASM domain
LDSTVHDSITTKPGSLEITLNNLRKLKEANIPVSIATQIMNINKDSVEDLYEYCEKNGFRFLCDWTIVAREDGSTDNLNLRVKDISEYKKICKIRIKHDPAYLKQMKENIALPAKSADSHLCNAGMNTLQIDTDLNIHPCPGWNINIGNLREVSIKEAWEKSPVLDRIRKTVLGDFQKCSVCEKRNICHICMAEAYNEKGGKFEMPEYECQFAEILSETIKNFG